LFEAYKIKFPAAKRLADLATRTANSRGFVKTLLGRRARFDKWAPSKWSSTPKEPLPYEEALAAYGAAISRSGTHKTLNSILQGSAADVMKTAMVQMVREGVTDVLGPPLLTVHDELVWSAPETKEALEALDHAKWIMCNCMPDLKVPMMVDDERGPNWGNVK
jgi:DNA polymerase I-like protein with 3'-5' exonuclease and polymerase domains